MTSPHLRLPLLAGLLASLLGLGHVPAHASDWPQWRGPDRNGYTRTDGTFSPSTRFTEQWKTNVGTGFSSISVVDGKLYTMGNRDNQDIVWCLNTKDGSEVWQHSYPADLDPNLYEGGPNATPTVDRDRVYTISRQGEIYCFDAASGKVHWQFSIGEQLEYAIPPWGLTGSPLILEDKVLFNAGSRGLCLNRNTGEVLWGSDHSDEAGYSSPLLVEQDGVRTVLLFNAKTLQAVDPETGESRWSFDWITRYGVNAADPVPVDENRLLISSGYSKGTALLKFDADQVEQLWRKRLPRNQLTPGMLIDGYFYAVDGDTNREITLTCLHVETGEITWAEPGFGSATMIRVNDHLLLLTEQGDLVILAPAPDQLNVLARTPILTGRCWTSPAFASGAVYARNAVGDLVRVNLETTP